MANDNEISQQGEAGVNRRNLLKGAVAAGVGVVAWSSPSITSIGMTPAYAAVCTGGTVPFYLGYRNTSCSCEQGSMKYVKYKELDPNACGIPDTAKPRPVTFNFDDSGLCPPGTQEQGGGAAGTATATIGAALDPSTDYAFCRIKVVVVDGQCSLTPLPVPEAIAYSDPVPAGSTLDVDMPQIECGPGSSIGNSGIFLQVYLECTNDEACFYI